MFASVIFWVLLFIGCEEPVEEPEVVPPAVVETTGDANVTNVFAREEADGTWTFHVSVTHKDVNWYDYADGWDLVLPDGTILTQSNDIARSLLESRLQPPRAAFCNDLSGDRGGGQNSARIPYPKPIGKQFRQGLSHRNPLWKQFLEHTFRKRFL